MANDDERETRASPTTTIPLTTPSSLANLDEDAGLGMKQSDGTKISGGSKSNENTGGGKDQPDFIKLNTLNLNTYASKKTLAQAILDLALLSANASQLKYILGTGKDHEFYTLLLWLVITSIVLQIVQAIICIILGLIFNINKVNEQKAADITNNICLCVVVLIVVVNVIISGFDMKGSSEENNRTNIMP